MRKINPSNTTLSIYKGNRNRKFDAKQEKRHDYGQAHCVFCDKVFTKYHWTTKTCSRECSLENRKAVASKYQKNNRGIINARKCEHRTENSERILAREHKYNEENREKINSRRRNNYAENPDEWNKKQREYYARKELQKQRDLYCRLKKWRKKNENE